MAPARPPRPSLVARLSFWQKFASLGIDEGRRLISLYSFRITAFNLMKEAERTGLVPVLTEDQRNKICSESHHTRFSTTQVHYVQANIVERVALMTEVGELPPGGDRQSREGDYLSLVTHTS